MTKHGNETEGERDGGRERGREGERGGGREGGKEGGKIEREKRGGTERMECGKGKK